MTAGRTAGGGSGVSKKGSTQAPAWKKPAGANLSAKAKKEYLKWKREQKRNAADESDSDWELEGAGEAAPAAPTTAGAAPVAAGQARPPGGGGGCERAVGGSRVGRGGGAHGAEAAPRRQQAKPLLPPPQQPQDGSDDDDDPQHSPQHADGRDSGRDVNAHPAPQPPGPQPPTAHGPPASGSVRATPDDLPLRYVPLMELPQGDVPEGIRAVCGIDVMKLPRVREDEVGFSEEGRRLGMPKRPAWRGVVRNAEQLHRLEERSFQAWMDRLYGSVDSPSRVSFFEPKLDFWRQLWRVLERSDVAIMIVDARNPLLHFSEALATHVLDEHGIGAILVLNKCDLVPAASVEAWRRWFEGRYPGLKVVASSAAAAGGAGAAAAIMDAVLDCEVSRDGRRVKVSEVLQMTRDQILEASKARNTHNKRDRPPAAPLPPESGRADARAALAPAAAAGRVKGKAKEREEEQEEPAGPLMGQLVGESDDGDEDWALQGTKARKKLAVRKKRNQRMHGGSAAAGGAAAAAAATAALPATAQRGGRATAHLTEPAQPAGGRRRGGSRGGDGGSTLDRDGQTQPHGRRQGGGARRQEEADGQEGAVTDPTEEEGEDEEEQEDGFRGAESGTSAESEEAEEEEEEEGDGSDNDNAAFDDLAEAEDREDFLEGDEGGGDEEEDAKGDSGERPTEDDEEAAEGRAGSRGAGRGGVSGGAGSWGGHGARGGRDRRGRSRPVVVCVVGEPNVGKSSTMNALLGAKRVAVSSHPGRTKHYQTHVMCPSLMLCDCPGLVFPRLDVSLHMQVLFGSYPIARCRDPYAVVRYLAERVWPRLHVTLGLKPVVDDDEEGASGGGGGGIGGGRKPPAGEWRDEDWTPLALCEAMAARHNWRSRRGGRLDVYRAANWILRSALAGRNGVDVAFLPPVQETELAGGGTGGEAAAATGAAGPLGCSRPPPI